MLEQPPRIEYLQNIEEAASVLITEEPILIYIDKHILTADKKNKSSMLHKLYKGVFITTKISAGVIGVLAGIPWINASKNAAIIIPDGIFREIIKIIFQAGIVITVGVDGSWIMYFGINKFKAISKEERVLTEGEGCSLFCSKTGKIIMPIAFSLLACIAPTYASFIYNEGWEKYFSIIAFIINYGYAFVGYSELADQAFPRMRDRCATSSLVTFKKELIKKTNQLCMQENLSFSNIDGATQLIKTICETDVSIAATGTRDKTKKIFQYTSALFVPVGMSVVRIFLTKDFLQTEVYDNNIFTISAAVFCEAPIYVVGFFSTYVTFGRLFDFITCNNRNSGINRCTKLKNYTTSSIVFLLSLTAPTAAAYVAYDTIGNASSSNFLSIFAAVAISVNCIIFSNFTLQDIVQVVSNFFRKKCVPQIKDDKKRLQKFAAILPKISPQRFACLAPLNVNAASVITSNVVPTEELQVAESQPASTSEERSCRYCNLL